MSKGVEALVQSVQCIQNRADALDLGIFCGWRLFLLCRWGSPFHLFLWRRRWRVSRWLLRAHWHWSRFSIRLSRMARRIRSAHLWRRAHGRLLVAAHDWRARMRQRITGDTSARIQVLIHGLIILVFISMRAGGLVQSGSQIRAVPQIARARIVCVWLWFAIATGRTALFCMHQAA